MGYSIVGGADEAKFAINSNTGQLSFASTPNYEVPTDSGGNNVYDVTVKVSDGNGGTDTQAIAVTVTNANETPIDLSLVGEYGGGERRHRDRSRDGDGDGPRQWRHADLHLTR